MSYTGNWHGFFDTLLLFNMKLLFSSLFDFFWCLSFIKYGYRNSVSTVNVFLAIEFRND